MPSFAKRSRKARWRRGTRLTQESNAAVLASCLPKTMYGNLQDRNLLEDINEKAIGALEQFPIPPTD